MDSNNGVLKKASLGEPIGVSVESPDPPIAESETQGSDDFEEYQAFKLIPAESKPREQTQKILFYQLAGLGFGIMAADIFSIQLLSLFLSPLGADVTNSIPTLLDTFLSGVVIGGGSQPVHALIRLISERKVDISSIEATPAAKMVAEPQVESNIQPHNEQLQKPPYQWQPIIYSGGVKPLSLEGRNRRGGNPIKIIYHHTAMHDHKSFQDIVNEFLVTKGWSTGYHSVIMPDGKVEPFCRWDRVGNHAKGNNNRTLGVSFHGPLAPLAHKNPQKHKLMLVLGRLHSGHSFMSWISNSMSYPIKTYYPAIQFAPVYLNLRKAPMCMYNMRGNR